MMACINNVPRQCFKRIPPPSAPSRVKLFVITSRFHIPPSSPFLRSLWCSLSSLYYVTLSCQCKTPGHQRPNVVRRWAGDASTSCSNLTQLPTHTRPALAAHSSITSARIYGGRPRSLDLWAVNPTSANAAEIEITASRLAAADGTGLEWALPWFNLMYISIADGAQQAAELAGRRAPSRRISARQRDSVKSIAFHYFSIWRRNPLGE